MTPGEDRFVLRDRELVELLVDEPELLAVLDAYAATQQQQWERRRRWRSRLSRVAVLAIAVAAVGVPAGAFGDEIGHILGLSNSGSPVASNRFTANQLSALARVGLPQHEVRLLALRAGIAFYAGRRAGGKYCFAVGFAPAHRPRFDALRCQPGTGSDSFPSSEVPLADFSALTARGGRLVVTRLAGFATDAIARVSILDSSEDVIFSTPVSDNVYVANDLPQSSAAVIVGSDQTGKVVYRKAVQTPPVPRPETPGATGMPR